MYQMEDLLGVIAVFTPCLKRPAGLLRRVGVLGEVKWPKMERPSFASSTRERSAVEQAGSMPLMHMGRLLHKESLMSEPGLGLARTRTRSTEWGGTPTPTTMVESGRVGIRG
jgi:hypothetical protein